MSSNRRVENSTLSWLPYKGLKNRSDIFSHNSADIGEKEFIASDRLKQKMANNLGNAEFYTSAGRVIISAV